MKEERLISFTLKPEGNKNVEERHFAYGLQHRGGRNQKTQCHSYITIYNDIARRLAERKLKGCKRRAALAKPRDEKAACPSE